MKIVEPIFAFLSLLALPYNFSVRFSMAYQLGPYAMSLLSQFNPLLFFVSEFGLFDSTSPIVLVFRV